MSFRRTRGGTEGESFRVRERGFGRSRGRISGRSLRGTLRVIDGTANGRACVNAGGDPRSGIEFTRFLREG